MNCLKSFLKKGEITFKIGRSYTRQKIEYIFDFQRDFFIGKPFLKGDYIPVYGYSFCSILNIMNGSNPCLKNDENVWKIDGNYTGLILEYFITEGILNWKPCL